MGKKILYLIPARAGSKGIIDKNIKLMNGKPLLQYTVDVALEMADLKDICLSTDSEKIAEVGKKLGLEIPFYRPEYLSNDTASMVAVAQHAIEFYESKGVYYDLLVVLQVTSPLRTAAHVKEAIALYSDDVDLVISVKETDANPYYLLYEEEGSFLQKTKKLPGHILRRQDAPKVFQLNGAVYVYNVEKLKRIKGLDDLENKLKYEMDKLASVDIDDMIDWDLCEIILSKQK